MILAIPLPLFARRAHKWLALFVGVQVIIWTLSGLYMTAVHIDIIHGDHFIRTPEARAVDPASLIDPLAAAGAVPGAKTVRLHWLGNQPTYIISTQEGAVLVNARSGGVTPPPSERKIRELANYWFTGDEPLADVRLVQALPFEVRGARAPLWRADFDGWNKPTLYFSPTTGELITRRHELWRVFDFVWMLHIMDYEERENVNNWLLRTFTWGAVAMAVSGAWLLVYNFPRRKRRRARS